jgi:SAM-dependent methyltransferase
MSPASIDAGQRGFEAYGIDFSRVAIRKARARAESAGVDPTFVVGDLTAPAIECIEGSFDFIIDFGTLDDLRGASRRAMAATINRLSRPGLLFLEYCFFGVTAELPRISFSGTSKMSHIAPGELDDLFGDRWTIEMLADHKRWRTAVFLLTRR